ncbi:MAG: sugar transferase [Qingshengfaniella sp.]
MTPAKRIFDLCVAVVAIGLLWPIMGAVALAILIFDGGPVFYRSERMRDAERSFALLKFRTMRSDPADAGVTGADKADRITRTGRVLRRYRLDELPQLVNVIAGDMSLVGPRPPLRAYVEAAPDLYRQVLRCRPGLTGLATLVYRRHEERLLRRCTSGAETHATYLRRCVPRKARLDLMYRDHRSLCVDVVLLGRTFAQVLGVDRRPGG